MTRTIFHIDANSAYLSWEAVYRLQHGSTCDLREVPAVVGGDPSSRRGIVLAKSIPAKKFGIKTGETLYAARKKCPPLIVVPPSYGLYIKCSNAMVDILMEYSPDVQRFSVDESFVDYSNIRHKFGDPIEAAYHLKDRIRDELGFTVNIGVSSNKLLAKMASELEKPDRVHTLFTDEIPTKMWPLPVEELFMVGRATKPKLNYFGIQTIGDLAKCDVGFLETNLKSFGRLIWQYANGIEDSQVRNDGQTIKGLGNSTTTSFDVEDEKTAYMFLLSLTETTAMRLREKGLYCQLVALGIKDTDFRYYSRQRKLPSATDSTQVIYTILKQLFKELWNQNPLRLFSVRLGELCSVNQVQLTIFTETNIEKLHSLDAAVDKIRNKYGDKAITRAVFKCSGISPLSGGVGDEEYPMMSSIL